MNKRQRKKAYKENIQNELFSTNINGGMSYPSIYYLKQQLNTEGSFILTDPKAELKGVQQINKKAGKWRLFRKKNIIKKT